MTKMLAAALIGWLGVAPLGAHHSIVGESDTTKTVQVRGVVTKVAWLSPHPSVYLTVMNPDGTSSSWQAEIQGPPQILERKGWSKTSVRVGDIIVAKGFLPRIVQAPPLLTLSVNEVLLADGTKLDATWMM